MEYKKIAGIVFSFCFICKCYTQNTSSDTLFMEFQKSIRQELLKQLGSSDTATYFFYGDKLNYNVSIENDYGGNKLVVNFSQLSEKNLTDSVFNTNYSYLDIINLFRSETSSDSCLFNLANIKRIVFIDCSMNSWIRFYSDNLLYSDFSFLPVVVDVIQAQLPRSIHRRDVLVFQYAKRTGFEIVNKLFLFERKICDIKYGK